MSKGGGWVPIDKGLVKTLPKDRPYSHVEAMFSHSVDVNCGRAWSVNGYADLWRWSRDKVRKFILEIKTEKGHDAGKRGVGAGKNIHYIDPNKWADVLPTDSRQVADRLPTDSRQAIDNKNGQLHYIADRLPTDSRQIADRLPDTTINPLILNPKKKEKNFLSDSDEIRLSELLFSKIKNRNPKHKEPNFQAWGKHVDLMLRADKRTPGEIERVICWCQEDSFWQNNILGTDKLRKQFDRLVLAMGVGQKTSKETVVTDKSGNVYSFS